MKIIFMGTPEFAVPSLEILLTSHHTISAVVTTPDKQQGRGLKLAISPVKRFALENKLKVIQPEDLKDSQFENELKKLGPDVIIVVAFRILPEQIFSIPKYGTFNLHASLLPKYRGAAPINWAIINGERETGVTTFFLKEKVDTGDVILQNSCEITDDDNAGTLHDKLAEIGARTVLSTISLIEMTNGNVPVYPQDESLFTKAPKITHEFCRINWDNSSETLHNFIRGLSPYPSAFSSHKGKLIKFYKCKRAVLEVINSTLPDKPGTAIVQNQRLFISCSDNFIEIEELQLEGKKRMTTTEFLRGYRINTGECFR